MDKVLQKINNGREYRKTMEVRVAGENEEYIVEGYATIFNQPYELFRDGSYVVNEQVDAHAFDECDMTDVIMQYDHEGRVFARLSNGTLEVLVDATGLHVRANLGGTEAGRQLYEEIKGGYTTKMSFGFTVAEQQRTYTDDEQTGETTVLRTITKISKLYDVSAVSIPANDATEISARNLSNGVIEEVSEERAAAEKRANDKKKLELRLRLMEEKHED